MNILDGKKRAEMILIRTEKSIQSLGIHPGLGIVLVGDDAASHLYVSLKERMAERLGIRIEKKFLLESVSKEEVKSTIETWNGDSNIHGILVQLPLPPHISTDEIIGLIDPDKDVDGFHPENERRFLANEPAFFPVFPRAVLELIQSSGEELRGKQAIVIGNSWTFGNMMCQVLEREGIHAKHLPCVECGSPQGLEEIKVANIVVSACGKERTVTGLMLSPGSIVIDGGIVKNGTHVTGDVDQASVRELEGFLSPVPGGVGPVTIACLLENVAEAAKRQKSMRKE